MANDDVSDASPPRRRARNEHADYVSSLPSPSVSDGLRNHPSPYEPFTASRASRSERRREHAASRLRPRSTVDNYETGKRYENTVGDVSDASPPRRRRRMDEHSRRTSGSSSNYLDGDENQSWRPSRRGTQPQPSSGLADNVSIHSTAISSLNYDNSKGRSSLSATRTHPSSTAPRGPPNRFGIRPGPRWDGVNRSNGFEDRLEAMRSMRRDVEAEGYRASVADL